jgi:hypothetical protein
MKMKLALALAVLFFASFAHADSVSTPDGTLVIPAGAVVTSIGISPTVQSQYGWAVYQVNFDFADGTGFTVGDNADGYGGKLDFTTPVSDVSFDWFGFQFEAQDSAGDNFFPNYDPGPLSPAVEDFPGSGITYLTWYSAEATGGITYIDPNADSQTVPEPSSLLLSGIGLAALIGLARRNRTMGQRAII